MGGERDVYLWHNDRYWPVGNASIKPILTGTVIGSVLLQFPGEKEFPVMGQEAQAVIQYAVRNNVSALVGQSDAPKTQFALTPATNGNGKKRQFSEDQIAIMREKRRKYWTEHPERWSQVHRKAAGIE